MSEKKQITGSTIIALLNEGKTRKEIAEALGMSQVDVKKLFQHPKLKNLKPRKQPGFEFVDDLDDDAPVAQASVEVVEQTVDDTADWDAVEN